MSLGVHELRKTITEIDFNLWDEEGLTDEGRGELLASREELVDEISSALGRTAMTPNHSPTALYVDDILFPKSDNSTKE